MAILKDHIKAGKNKQLRRSCIVNYSWALGSSNCLLLTCLQLPEFITFHLHCGPHSIQDLQPHWGKTWCIDCPTFQVQTKKNKKASSDFPSPHRTIFLSFPCPALIDQEWICVAASQLGSCVKIFYQGVWNTGYLLPKKDSQNYLLIVGNKPCAILKGSGHNSKLVCFKKINFKLSFIHFWSEWLPREMLLESEQFLSDSLKFKKIKLL